MIIDFHTHNFPAALAPRALEVMCGKLAECGHSALVPCGDGTVATELADMDRSGVDICVNCPVCTRPRDFEAIVRRALAVRGGSEGAEAVKRIVQLGSINPTDEAFRERIRVLRENGIPGIKLHPNYQGIRLDDPALVPFFAELRDAGLFVISHCGFDPGYVHAPSVAGPHEIAALLRAVPGLRFVAAHVGGEYDNDPGAVDSLLEFPNCLIDTAVMYLRYGADEPRRIVSTWPADRIVFGTDYFWRDQKTLVEWVRSLRPSQDDLELIFHGNAERLLGLAGESR